MAYNFYGAVLGDFLERTTASLIYFLITGGLTVILYVLRSVGVYSIAKRRGIRHPWFAWLPIVDQYLLGCISDQYHYVVRGENRSKRKILLILSILAGVAYAVLGVLFMVLAVNSVVSAAGGMGEMALVNQILSSLVGVLLVMLVMGCVGIVRKIVRYIVLYDLYRSCDPDNGVIYLILGMFFAVTEPFFIFFSRKKDLGMPPRRPVQPEYIPPEPQYQPPRPEEEPWGSDRE